LSGVAGARGVWNAATARGPGYEPQPPGSRFDGHSVRGYFVDLSAKTRAPSATAPEKLPPAGLAQLALGWWERALVDDAGAWDAFEQTCALLRARAQLKADEWRWPYSMPLRKYLVRPPWFSAMAQGQIASVFVRAWQATGDQRDREVAEGAIAPLLAEHATDLVTMTDDGPILEEAPSLPRSHILNGWVYAMWGLWDVSVGLCDERAAERFEASARCLATLVDRYDLGWWTRYSLYPHRIADLAKPFYHTLHSTQIEITHELIRLPQLAHAARRWRSYDEPLRRCRALAQKAVFVAAVRSFGG
jgi:heparosan-N-sulfate-glucuronate 5-epimerase